MRKPQLVQLGSLAAVVILMILVGSLVGPINQQREELQLRLEGNLDESAPPQVVLLTQAAGAFRGLAVDFLWYRANQLKESGKYYEANTLSELITTLQPQFAQVWAFHAWNMAYNISVATHTPEERWSWVKKGVDLLREQGVRYNPQAPRVYRELGWIFFHKIGQFSDDMHWYYKTRMIFDWQELMGAPPMNASTDEVIEAFKRIADAPQTEAALIEMNPDVGPIITALRQNNLDLDQDTLRLIGQYDMFADSLDAGLLGIKLRDMNINYPDFLFELLNDPENAEAVEDLKAFLRNRVLRRDYNMDPDFMYDLMHYDPDDEDDFGAGPLDWRHPSAHAAYWSAKGVDVAVNLRETEEVDQLNTDRQVVHAMQNLTNYGRISFDPVTKNLLDQLPDARFIPAYDRAMDSAKRRVESGEFASHIPESFDSGHENFLHKAVFLYYVQGDLQKARAYHQKARRLYGTKRHNISRNTYTQPLDNFVYEYIEENLELMGNTGIFLNAMIGRALREGLANGNMAAFEKYMQIAKMAHKAFNKDASKNPGAIQDRMRLLSFDKMFQKRFRTFMSEQSLPPLLRARVWANTPTDIQRAVYDQIADDLKAHAQAAGLDVNRAFPAPPELEQARQQRIEESKELSDTETGEQALEEKARIERQ